MKKLSLNKIYLGGVTLLFLLSLLFTLLAIFEEYRSFEKDIIKLEQNEVKKSKDYLKTTANKILNIIKLYPNDYKKILQIMLNDDISVKIYFKNRIIYKNCIFFQDTLSYKIKTNNYSIEVSKPLSSIKKLIINQKKVLKHKLIKTILNFLTISFIIYMLALAWFYLLNEFLKEEINKFIEFFKKAYLNHIYIKSSDIKIKEFFNIAIYVNKMLKEINKKNKELKNINQTLEEKVKEKTKKLQNLIKLQENFIKTAIHEINTPLAIILTSLSLIEKKDKNLKRIESAVLMINNIYSDLSFVLKYKHKNFPLQNINIKDILIERIEFFETIANSKNLEIKYSIEDFNIIINKEELIRIIDNNLSNAIKYSIPNSFIVINAKNNSLIFKNKTNEIKNIRKFFEPFYQEKENNIGFGLGLYIVNEICKKYNIKVNVFHKDNIISFEYIFKETNENSSN